MREGERARSKVSKKDNDSRSVGRRARKSVQGWALVGVASLIAVIIYHLSNNISSQ